MSFASIDDYEAKYGSVGDESVLQAWLDDATVHLTALLRGTIDPEDEDQAGLLRTVCRDMAHRAYASVAPGYGVTSYSQGANGFSESMSYANATGDLYLTKAEKALLGIGNQQIGWYDPYDQSELGGAS